MVRSQVLMWVICILALSAPQCCVPTSTSPRRHYKPACCMSEEKTFGPFVAYVTSPYNVSKAAVVVATNIFGFEPPLTRKFADKVASAGYFVVMPDFFNGDPYDPATARDTWTVKHRTLDSVLGAKQVIELLYKKGFSSVGAVGFCWGGNLVVKLAKEKSLKAVVAAHPSYVTVEEIQEVKTPIEILGAELDTIAPPALIRQFEDILESKPKIKSFVKIYPGVAHGWTIRYNPDNPEEVAAAEEAQRKMIEWLDKFLLYKKT